MTTPRTRGAVFLDRDGTIIRDVDYASRVEDVELIPGAAAAVQRLNEAGVPVIVVTNQSGIARGLLTIDDYKAVATRVDALLGQLGARLDATYFCPHHPDFTGPCECRKPGTQLFREGATDHTLDLSRSAFIGDRWRDIEPAAAFGARGILVPSDATPAVDRARSAADAEVASSLGEAVGRVLAALAGASRRSPRG